MSNKNIKTNQVLVEESGQGKYSQTIIIGQHHLTADEPVSNGGNDTGPSPYDFILSGLGACTSMTIRMYADFKKIPLTRVIVRLTYAKIHAQDCENCENENAFIDHINRVIELQGPLSTEQCQKLLEIANKCPVHRTLTSKVSITTELGK